MMVIVLRFIDVLKHFSKKKVLFSSLVRGVSASLFSGIKKAVFLIIDWIIYRIALK